MGGGSSTQQANTTTNTDYSTWIGGSVGFTGPQGLQALKIFRGIQSDLLDNQKANALAAYQFSTISVQSAYANLANNIDATRAIAGGQSFLPPATQPTVGSVSDIGANTGGGGVSKGLVTAGIVVAVAGLGVGLYSVMRK